MSNDEDKQKRKDRLQELVFAGLASVPPDEKEDIILEAVKSVLHNLSWRDDEVLGVVKKAVREEVNRLMKTQELQDEVAEHARKLASRAVFDLEFKKPSRY
jgi:hypothetical protein